jgi:hypothetical protein
VGVIAVAAAAVVLAAPQQRAAAYLLAHRNADGAFAEPGAPPTRSLSAWAALGLGAAGISAGAKTVAYIQPLARDATASTDVELGVLGITAASGRADQFVPRLRGFIRPTGSIGPAVNSTIFGVLALRQAHATVAPRTVRYLLSRQSRSGGWSWSGHGAPDSNDTAAAVEALDACGIGGRPLARGLRYLRGLENRDGGFALARGEASDAQSTAWAIQAFVAAGRRPPRAAFHYLLRLQRRDGSFRYSERYATTPVFVTAQVLPALVRVPFPLG